MEPEYLDEPRVFKVKGLNAILEQFKARLQKDIPTKKGGLNEVTQLRMQTADLLRKPLGQVQRLTKGWSTSELRDTLKICNEFVNPPALWWRLYKKNKDMYGRKGKRDNQKTLRQNRKERREAERQERQSSLF